MTKEFTTEEKLALLEQEIADIADPNVLLIRGYISGSGGDGGYYCVTVDNSPLVEALENLKWAIGKSESPCVTFEWHITEGPNPYERLQENVVATAMGDLETTFHHAYSELTGYLWTTEELKVGGHDVLKEIRETMKGFKKPYLYLRATCAN